MVDFKQNPYQRSPGLQRRARRTAGGGGTHYSVILWLTQTERLQQRELGRGGREGERERGRKASESRENKCERKILNHQNSSHKTLGPAEGSFYSEQTRLCSSAGCQACCIMKTHWSLGERSRTVGGIWAESNHDSCSSLQCACWFYFVQYTELSTYVALQVCGSRIPGDTGDHGW